MRYTASYIDGLESVDRRHRIRIVSPEGKADDQIQDDDTVVFLRYNSETDFEIIARCRGAVYRQIYKLLMQSIPDGNSVTARQLYAAIRHITKICTDLWDSSVRDCRIDKHM